MSRRNPYEVPLGLAGGAAFVGGIIMSGMGTAAYKKESDVSEMANAMSGSLFSSPDAAGLAWATFGNQLSIVGVVILVGMAFYFMTRWNAT